MGEPDAIARHSAQAGFYRYRVPYHPGLFAELAKRLKLGPASTVLDVCCGSGEVASGLVNHAGRIFAIDGSAEMLSFAPPHRQIVYARCDVNADAFRAPEPVDHFVIGRAVHWLTPQGLTGLMDRNLRNDGKIVVCSVQWQAEGGWHPSYRSVLEDYTIRSRTKKTYDFTGADTLRAVGFQARDRFAIEGDFSFDLPYLVGLAQSETYGESLENLRANAGDFAADIGRVLSPYLRAGQLTMATTSWALIYERDRS
jgi:SAM-dependent methyltransferase